MNTIEKEEIKASQLCDAHLIDYAIGNYLKAVDPIFYAILKIVMNDKDYNYQSIISPDFKNLDSIYRYFINIFTRISIKDKKRNRYFKRK